MNNALLYLGGILITALAVLFAVPRFVDWNSYRGVFEEEASRILGREVRVGGAVNVRLLPAPFVSFERLRIADVGEAGGTAIIRVESFTMWLSVPPLLRGVLEAHRVDLRRPVVSLATNTEGSGNWRTLSFAPGSFRFAPKDVALQSVEIHDGAIVIAGPQQNELARLEAINGEFTAEALDGPFKFKGSGTWGGTPRHIKLATSKLDHEGVLRFKSAVDAPDSGNSYVFDGRLSDLKDKPVVAGELSAKFALAHGPRPAPATAEDPVVEAVPETPGVPPPSPPAPTPPQLPAQPAAAGGARSFDLKAKVTGTTTDVKLSEIAVSLDAGATPQLVTGEATFDWKDRMRLDVALASRWLDLDQIAPPDATQMPLEAGRGYFEALAAALPQEADTNAKLEFDQLTLGGEPIGNVRLAASRAGGPLTLKGVRADLPGGVRMELDGVLTPSAKAPRLDGTLFVSGKSLLRFLAWGFADPKLTQDRGDGTFSMDGTFALGDGTLGLTDVAFVFADTPLKGELRVDLGAQKKLAMVVEGPRIDMAQVGPGTLGLDLFRAALLGPAEKAEGAKAAQGADAPAPRFLDPKTADLALDLKAAEIVNGDRVLTDVDASLRLDRGRLAISRLNFATPEGLRVEVAGEASDVPEHPKGVIRGLVAAPNKDAAQAFLSLLEMEPTLAADLDRVARLAPFRLAGSLTLAGAPADASRLTLDGSVGPGRVSATLRLDGGRAAWRSAPLALDLKLENSDVARVLATLADARRLPTVPAAAAPSGRLVVKAEGVPAEELLVLADASGDGLSLSYRGKARLPDPDAAETDGHLQIVAADARDVLMLAGLANADAAAGTALSGTLHVRRDPKALRLSSEAVTLGTSVVSGDVTLTRADEDAGGRQTIEANLATTKTSFASLLWPVLGKMTEADVLQAVAPAPARAPSRQGAGADADTEGAAALAWPDRTFDLSMLDTLQGTIDLKMGALQVEPGLAIRNARLAATLAPSGVSVTKLTGEAVGGRLISNFDLAKASAGVDVSGALRIDIDGKPLPADASEPPPPGDAVAFGVTFASRALSPAAAVSTLAGKGEITIGNATLAGNSPAAVAAVARAALTGQGPSSGAPLSEAVREALKTGEVDLGKLTIPVEIGDGALKLERVRIEMKDGRSTFATAVELATMKIDSEWQIEAKLDAGLAASPEQALLPPVTVVYTGKLSQFADLVPAVSADALERELVVRKMEIDVGELERLRKLDEERARADAVRRKAEEEERARIEAERRRALEADRQAPRMPDASDAYVPSGQGSPAPDDPASVVPEVYDDSTAPLPPEMRPDGADVPAATAAPRPPTASPSPAAQRPVRRKRPAEEEWRPFQSSPF